MPYSPRDLAARIQGLASTMAFDKALAVVKQEIESDLERWWNGIGDFVIRACDRQYRTDARRLPVAAGTPWTERYFGKIAHPIANTGVRKALMAFGRDDAIRHGKYMIRGGETEIARGKLWVRIGGKVPEGRTIGDVFSKLTQAEKDFLAREAGLRRERGEEAAA